MRLYGLRRWIAHHFRTRVTRAPLSRFQGRVITTDEWEAVGGWDGAMTVGWKVSRPDWWGWGATSGITSATAEEARARLDEWQDDMFARFKASAGERQDHTEEAEDGR